MNKTTFLKELKFLLSDISDEECQEALSYYADYFDEAGIENEQKVIQELGSPEKVAAIIKDSIKGHFEENITGSEKGFTNQQYEKVYEVQNIKKEDFFERFARLTIGYKALLIFLILFCLLPITALLADVLGIGLSFVVSILTFIFGAWVLTFAFIMLGITGIVSGVITAFHAFPLGLILIGLGMMLLAMSLLTKELAKLIFRLLKMLWQSIQSLFSGKEETV